MQKYGEVTVAWTIKPKDYHSMTRGRTLPVMLPDGATPEQVLDEHKRLEALLVDAVTQSLELGLKGYGKTLKEVL